MTARIYSVACLSGDGVGPELVAEASRALQAVAALHGFRIEDAHLPFGGDGVRRTGHAFPPETRAACRAADAVLVAATREPALEAVKAELDLVWRVQRVRILPDGDLVVVSPLAADAEKLAVDRAFEIACTRGARVLSVGASGGWRRLVERAADANAGVLVEHRSLEEALPILAAAPERFDVVVTEEVFAQALSDMAAFGREDRRIVASGRVAESGRGVFGPTHGSAPELAGHGVADPSGIVLAASLLLGEGLGERAAAETLAGAVTGTLRFGPRTADMVDVGTAATTREFMDALLSELPGSRRDAEFGKVA